MDTSFFEIKKADGCFELYLNKEINGERHSLLIKRSVGYGILSLGFLVQKCELNSMELGHLQRNAK